MEHWAPFSSMGSPSLCGTLCAGCQKVVVKSLPFILNPEVTFSVMPMTNTFPPHLFCRSHSQGPQKAGRWDRWDR